MGGAVRGSARGKLGEVGRGTPPEGLRATGGGALGGFFGAWGGRCSEMLLSSATRFRWRSAWVSGDTGRSSCSFLVPLEKMKLAVEAGDRGSASGGPLGWAPTGSVLTARLEALSRTAAWSPKDAADAGLALPERALRSGFWGGDGPDAGFGATVGGPTERSRTVCRSEGVTRGGLASSRGRPPPLLQPTGSFRGALARSPATEPAAGGAGGAGGGSGVPEGWFWKETADKEASGRGEGPAGSGLATEKKASSGGGKSAMDRSCSSGVGGGGGGQLGSSKGSLAVSRANKAPSTTSGFLVGGGGG